MMTDDSNLMFPDIARISSTLDAVLPTLSRQLDTKRNKRFGKKSIVSANHYKSHANTKAFQNILCNPSFLSPRRPIQTAFNSLSTSLESLKLYQKPYATLTNPGVPKHEFTAPTLH